MRAFTIIFAGLALLATPALAHKLIEPGFQKKIARGAYTASPETTWNRLGKRQGKYQEIWTIDGDQLNRAVFFGGVPEGEPLFRERNKKLDPLPKFASNMILPDIPTFLERTYRVYFGSPIFTIGEQQPANFAGMNGIRFSYEFMDVGDEVQRKGEAYGAIKDGKLYLVTYEAPTLYYFDRNVEDYRQIVSSLDLRD